MIDEHHTIVLEHEWHYRDDLVARFSLTWWLPDFYRTLDAVNPSVCNNRVIFADKRDHFQGSPGILDEKRFILDEIETISNIQIANFKKSRRD